MRPRSRNKSRLRQRLSKLMPCLRPGHQEQRANEMIPSSESLRTKDNSESAHSSPVSEENDEKLDMYRLEEAELSLRESGSLNYEEARAVLGRYEYQKGNIEAALHVFEGIDIATLVPKIKITLGIRGQLRNTRSQSYSDPPLSPHSLSLLLEAMYLKSKSLQILGRYKESAQTCKVILDAVESSLPEGVPENFGADSKLQETLHNAIELLPESWKLAESHQETISSFRRALLYRWNLGEHVLARIQKEFAVFLLYSGSKDANPPNLRSQMDGSFVPRNNLEEAILLLMILIRKSNLKKIKWDPSVFDHLLYALSISGGLPALGKQLEELLPGVIERKERNLLLALCYYGQGDGLSALNLLKSIYKHDDPNCLMALLMASKICGENMDSSFVEEGVDVAKRAIWGFENKCDEMVGVANSLLGVLYSAQARSALSDSDRTEKQTEALRCLESGVKLTNMNDTRILYWACLENADQRKLDVALEYAKRLVEVGGGAHVPGWILTGKILTGQKRFSEGESVVDAGLDQTGQWEQGELLRMKAKIQVARGEVRKAVRTYTQLLGVLQVQSKSFGSQKRKLEVGEKHHKDLEMETWHDLAMVYISLCQWSDAEECLSKSMAISFYSASCWHITGLLYEAKGLYKEALKAYKDTQALDPTHVPSLISMATVLKQLGTTSGPVARSFLTEALRLDHMNSSAWYTLGQFYKEEGPAFTKEAVECFEAATLLEETEPVEPFR